MPYSGGVEANKKRAADFAEFAYREGNIPVTVHLLFPFMDDTEESERKTALFMDTVLMGKCQEVWVLGDILSTGKQREIDVAKKRRQTIRYFNNEFQEVRS